MAAQDPRPPRERSALQGLDMSRVRGFHPRLLNELPSGEHGFECNRPSTLQPTYRGFETTSST